MEWQRTRILSAFVLSILLIVACQTSTPITQEQIIAAQQRIATIPLSSNNYASEATDFHIAPVSTLRTSEWHSATPLTVPGARTITTQEFQALLRSNPGAILLDVLGGDRHDTVPGALWLKGAGLGSSFDDEIQHRLATRLQLLTGGDRSRPIVTFCLSSHCWLSYNTSLRLVALGYTDVHWYRGGNEAWTAAGLPMVQASLDNW